MYIVDLQSKVEPSCQSQHPSEWAHSLCRRCTLYLFAEHYRAMTAFFCGEIPNALASKLPESIILLCNTKQFASIHFILCLWVFCLLQNYYLSLLSLLFSPLTLTAFVRIETNTSCCHLMPGTLQGKKDRTQQVSQKLSQYVRMKALGETLPALPFEKARFSQS